MVLDNKFHVLACGYLSESYIFRLERIIGEPVALNIMNIHLLTALPILQA